MKTECTIPSYTLCIYFQIILAPIRTDRGSPSHTNPIKKRDSGLSTVM
jgi:hypothetical protein